MLSVHDRKGKLTTEPYKLGLINLWHEPRELGFNLYMLAIHDRKAGWQGSHINYG
jgi:hypothetical protein